MDSRTYHCVYWDAVSQPLECGGLGIKEARFHNRAFMGKWIWCFGIESESLPRRVIVENYGRELAWDPQEFCGVMD